MAYLKLRFRIEPGVRYPLAEILRKLASDNKMEVEIELTPEVIRDFKAQLAPQIKAKNLTIAELQELMDAVGISPKNVINFLLKK